MAKTNIDRMLDNRDDMWNLIVAEIRTDFDEEDHERLIEEFDEVMDVFFKATDSTKCENCRKPASEYCSDL